MARFVVLLVLALSVGCEGSPLGSPAVPDMAELECSWVATGLEPAPIEPYPGESEARCLRIDAEPGHAVRHEDHEGTCSAWSSCVTLQPGERVQLGSRLIDEDPGTFHAVTWPCADMPPCSVPYEEI